MAGTILARSPRPTFHMFIVSQSELREGRNKRNRRFCESEDGPLPLFGIKYKWKHIESYARKMRNSKGVLNMQMVKDESRPTSR